jgi:hypothetical protein
MARCAKRAMERPASLLRCSREKPGKGDAAVRVTLFCSVSCCACESANLGARRLSILKSTCAGEWRCHT